MVKVGALTVAGLATHSPRPPHARARRAAGPQSRAALLPGSVSKAPPKTLASLCLPTQAALQWEHWFCCGGFSVGVVRQTLRLCLLARSNLGYPYIPREYRASSRAGAVRHEPPG